MSYVQQLMTCRFCGESAHVASLVMYVVRHYAHQNCYLDRRGLDGLHPWQVGHLSWQLLEERGLMKRAESILKSVE